MGGRRILSDPQIDEMAELRERGWTLRQIARHFSAKGTPVSEGSIGWQCLRVGADLPPERRRPGAFPACLIQRGGKPVRPWTPAEDEQLLALEAQGTSLNAIGRAIGRKQNSVRGRLMTLARHQARAEDAA